MGECRIRIVRDYLGRVHLLDEADRLVKEEEPHPWEDGSVPFPGVPTCLAQLPEEERDADVCLKSVRIGGRNLEWVPEALKAPALCLAAVRQDAAALRFAPPELQEPLRRWLAAGLEEPPADWTPEPLEAARGALLAAAEEWKLLGGAAAECAARPSGGNGFDVSLRLADPEGRLYAAGAAPCVRASYRVQDGAAPDPAACLRAFAEKLAGPAEGMPAGMRKFWAAAFRLAAEAAEEAEPRNAGLRERRREAADRARRDWTEYESLPAELRTEAVLRSAARGMAWEGLRGRPPKRAPEMEELQDAAQKACLAAVGAGWNALKFVPEELKTPEVCLEAVRNSPGYLKFVPEGRRTAEICKEAAGRDGGALRWVPDALKTEKLCLDAVKAPQIIWFAMEFVPEKLKTPDICEAAVRQDGMALECVPDRMKTEELCLAAVQQNGRALKHAPDRMKTPDVCLAAVRQNPMALELAPEETKTADMYAEAVRQEGRMLQDMPDAMKTEEICLAAVRQNGEALEWTPEALKTQAVCEAAVRQCGRALAFAPAEFRTHALCLAAVRQSGLALEFVPEALRTPEVCLAAVRRSREESGCAAAAEFVPDALRSQVRTLLDGGFALMDMPADSMTADMCLEAVKANGAALQFLPEELKTPEVCLAAVRRDGKALEWTPEGLRTEDICLEAVRQDARALEFVPEELKTPEICLEAARHGDAYAFREYVPEELKTKEMYAAAHGGAGSGFENVPNMLKTEAMCLEAVRLDGRLLAHVPGWLQTEEVCMAAVQSRPRMLAWVPFWRTTPEICLEAVRRDRTALQYVPSGMQDRIARLAAEVPAPPAGPLEAACAAFAARAGECPLPEGCLLRLEAERPGDGCVRLRIEAADPQGIAWPEGSAPSASAAYRADGGGEPDPAACLRAFAEKLAGTAGKPVETMPEGMKAFCAEAVRAAAGAAAGCAPAKGQDENQGPARLSGPAFM